MHNWAEPFHCLTFAEREIPNAVIERILQQGWPRFMLFDPVAALHWTRLYVYFPQFQFGLYDADDRLAVLGNGIPFAWDGQVSSLSAQGWDWLIQRGVADYQDGRAPTALAALAITVSPDYAGQGASRSGVAALRMLAAREGLTALVAPLRPNFKARYPLIPMERYITWTTADGEPLDPWLRLHCRAGGRIVGVCPESMTIPGSVAQWEEWTEMRFPETGAYVVPGALNPVAIDVERDLGVYVEPGVWAHHTVAAEFEAPLLTAEAPG